MIVYAFTRIPPAPTDLKERGREYGAGFCSSLGRGLDSTDWCPCPC